MKVYPNIKRTIVLYLVCVILLAIALVGTFFNYFFFQEWAAIQIIIIIVWVILSILMGVFGFIKNYYLIESKYLTQVKGSKELVYYYSDIIYIDEEQSVKKKTLSFYTKQGHVRYLTFDKEGLIYKTMISKCKNLISKEEFKEKYPKVKI